MDQLGPYVEWVRVCPEVELGLGVPRDKIHLVSDAHSDAVRLLQGERDLTASMGEWTRTRVSALRKLGLHGYVTKTRSPSCGLTDVEVLRGGQVLRDGVGLFAGQLQAVWPGLPICEETDLDDKVRRESMIAAIFLLHRWEHRGGGLEGLRRFHQRHQLFWIWRGADSLEQWEQRMQGEVDFLEELEDCYHAWMIDLLKRPIDDRNAQAVADFTGCRVTSSRRDTALLDLLRRTLYDERPELRPDRFFDPYPPELQRIGP